MKSVLKSCGVVAVLCGLSAVSSAHHSFALFDMSKKETLNGVVKEFQWTNPHSWLFLTVQTSSGEVQEWQIEALSPNVLGRQGWKKNSLKPGDKVTVIFNPTRDGTHGGNLLSVADEQGKKIGGPAQ